MSKQEWEIFSELLKRIGVKPNVIESRNGQGELLGYVVRLQADNVKFLVDMVQVVVPPPKTFEAPTKKVRTKKS